MVDPVTLSAAAIGATALTEGIKFLYAEAGALLKRWREKRDIAATTKEEEITLTLPDVFGASESTIRIHFEDIAKAEDSLRALRKDVMEYAEGVPVDMANESVLEQVDALRRLLEAIFRRPLTFKGETRSASHAVAVGEASIDEVLGYVAGVRIRTMSAGTASGKVTAKKVSAGGQAVGTEIDTLR
jgi:hypothetical protein